LALLIIAHRGDSANWPENTLPAFRAALDVGADLIELDVQMTRDGEVVVIHDPVLDRTTSGKGKVGERTLARSAPSRPGMRSASGASTRASASPRWPRPSRP
jgi:glycerophosphoryl diester phosphodiesterase